MNSLICLSNQFLCGWYPCMQWFVHNLLIICKTFHHPRSIKQLARKQGNYLTTAQYIVKYNKPPAQRCESGRHTCCESWGPTSYYVAICGIIPVNCATERDRTYLQSVLLPPVYKGPPSWRWQRRKMTSHSRWTTHFTGGRNRTGTKNCCKTAVTTNHRLLRSCCRSANIDLMPDIFSMLLQVDSVAARLMKGDAMSTPSGCSFSSVWLMRAGSIWINFCYHHVGLLNLYCSSTNCLAGSTGKRHHAAPWVVIVPQTSTNRCSWIETSSKVLHCTDKTPPSARVRDGMGRP